MSFYSTLQQISSELLQQFGSPCVVKTSVPGKYNPMTGEQKSSAEVAYNAYCLFDNLAYDFPSARSGIGKGESATVKQGDVLIYVTSSGKPEVNSLIEVNGECWSVIRCQPIQPANSALLYQCQGRKR